jgi:signal transduction histidine kinase
MWRNTRQRGSVGTREEHGGKTSVRPDEPASYAWMEGVRVSRPLSPAPPSVTPVRKRQASTRLHGRNLLLVRTVWITVAVLSVLCIAFGILAEFARLQAPCAGDECQFIALTPTILRELEAMGLSAGFFAAYLVAVKLIFATVTFAVGTVIFWRKSDDRIALFAALALVTLGGEAFAGVPGALLEGATPLRAVALLVSFLGNTSIVLLFYLLPDGRFVPRWTRVLAVVFVAFQVGEYFIANSPLSAPGESYDLALNIGILASIVYAQIYRYRRVSGLVERQQTKLVVFGIAATVIGTQGVHAVFPLLALPQTILVLAGQTIYYMSLLLMPVSIGIAVLRHHLFDIDFVINRTLVYGALTASVVLLYVLVVGGLGELLQIRGNLIISLIATGLAAVTFQPLRERLQLTVNRLMYGERDAPYTVPSRLGQRLETSLAPDAVLPAAVRSVAEALKLPYVAVEVGKDGVLETVAATGEPMQNPLRLPLVYRGETVGSLVLGPRAGEERFSPADQRLLEDLAHQIGVAAHAARLAEEAVQLSADLQRSRVRLVEAREEERRRLRRDLHDGLGPQLSSQALTVDAVRTLMRRDPDAAEELLLDLKADAQDAVTDIRRLVYGLRPPALDDLGLLGALRESAAQYGAKGLSVSVEAPEKLPPLSAAVEVAAYRIAQEALTNVARHAGADTCTISVAIGGSNVLCLEVRDDGRGIPDPRTDSSVRAGVGLTSMRERATELGGSLVVESLPEVGTLVRARLPLPEEE